MIKKKKTKKQKDPLNSTWLYCKNKNSQIKLTAHLKKLNRYCFTYPATSPKDKISSFKWTDEEADRLRSGTWTEETYNVYK